MQNIDFAGASVRSIWFHPCDNCNILNNLCHDSPGGDTNACFLVGHFSDNTLISGNHIWDHRDPGGSLIEVPLTCDQGTNCTVQDNYIHDVERAGIQLTGFHSGAIVRRNTVNYVGLDPNIYIVGAQNAQVYENVILGKMVIGGTPAARPLLTFGLEQAGHVGNRGHVAHHNLLGFGTSYSQTFLIGPNFPTDPADKQDQYNIAVFNNTIVKTNCCGAGLSRGALAASDSRSPPDAGDYSAIVWRDNLLWEQGIGTTIALLNGITFQTIDRNFYQTSTMVGSTFGTNVLNSNTVPFAVWDNDNSWGDGDNFNLTAATGALNSGTSGVSRGALQPPQLQSVVIANGTPTQATWTFQSAFGLQLCTAGKFTLSGVTITGCTVTSPTTITTPFTGTVTVGQTITAALQQGAVKASAIGCATAQCATYGAVEYTHFWRHENYPYSGFAVTNQVQTGCAPTVANCTIPDSASDDHVIFTLNSCESDPILPASGVTGFVITEQDAGTKTCSAFTRSGQTQLDCDTTAVTAGKTVTWTYGSGTAGPTTPELDTCNGGEVPLSTGWTEDIDSDHVGVMQETPNWCFKGNPAGEGSAWRDSGTFGPDSEMWGIWGDATHTSGFFDFHVRIQQVNSPAPDSYACRADFSTDPGPSISWSIPMGCRPS